MKIGVYGGTFDPPHLGHMCRIKRSAEQLGVDKLLFIPAATPPHKALRENSATAEQRLSMLKIAVDQAFLNSEMDVAVDDLELCRAGNSYTSDTLRELKGRYPDDRLCFFMGSDMLRSFRTWHEPEVICSLAELAVFARFEQEDAELIKEARRIEEDFHTKVSVLTDEVIEISSTEIRDQLLEGGKRPEKLPVPVYGYILRHGLYGTHADLKHLSDDDLRACVLSMVYAKRHAHILGVEEEAVRLAQRWGGDPGHARRAAILHDCTKYYTPQEHMDICQRYGVELDALERQSEKLLHAKTGAALACHIFGEPREVQAAIYFHTTGKGNMTTLEKILYLADYMEPNRDFPGVERLRDLAYVDLDAAVALGCEMSIAEMEEKGREVHPNTRAALESLRH